MDLENLEALMKNISEFDLFFDEEDVVEEKLTYNISEVISSLIVDILDCGMNYKHLIGQYFIGLVKGNEITDKCNILMIYKEIMDNEEYGLIEYFKYYSSDKLRLISLLSENLSSLIDVGFDYFNIYNGLTNIILLTRYFETNLERCISEAINYHMDLKNRINGEV